MTTAQHLPIAVVGVSALFPGSVDKTSFWRNILEERDLIGDVPASHWLIDDYFDADPSARDKTYAKRGGFLPAVDFDAMKWGVPPTIMPATDSTQLLALIVAQRVIDDACRGQFGEALRDRTSVFLGVTSAQELLGTMVSRLQRPVWVKALREMGLPESQVTEACTRIADQYVEWQESSFPGVLGNVVAGRIANRLDLGGANCVTDAACASTFSALSMGINELRLGTSDLVIAGGADTMNDIFMYMCFSKTPALSPSGDCRPFSDGADGTLLGEGIGMVALKRLDDAEQAGDRIYAVIKGLGASSDGRAKSVYAPVAEGQANALRRAYGQAGYGPSTVGLVEAHGTGTKAGDAAEFQGLRLVFEEDREAGGAAPWCALGSVKAQIGHTKAAAGAAGLFKAIMALHHKVLPATLKVARPNPALTIEESPFYLNATTRPWIAPPDAPRRAGVSSFGFGGSNYHVTLEEYGGPGPRAPRLRALASELVLLSAADVVTLTEACRAVLAELGTGDALAFVARRSQQSFDASAPCRLALVAEDDAGLASKLENACAMVAGGKSFRSPTGVFFECGAPETGLGWVFPGQGSQYVGMGRDLALAFDVARAPWDEASTSLGALHELVFPKAVFDDEARAAQLDQLTATENAQPAIGLTTLSLMNMLTALKLEPSAVAGHSFGEVMALCAGGAIDAAAALGIARERGRLMAAAASAPGAMVSVRAEVGRIEALLADELAAGQLVIANHNAPQQVVLAGPTELVDQVVTKLEGLGLSATRLQVATAFHSPIVAGAVAPFRALLEEVTLSTPRVPVLSNRDAAPYASTPEAMRSALAEQLSSRVRFVECIEAMYGLGVRTFLEVGPGHVLTGLVGRILAGRPHRAVALDRKGRPGVTSMWEALAQLACAGIAIDFEALWHGYEEPANPAGRPAMKMPIAVSGTSYGKLYPPAEGTRGLPKPNPERAVNSQVAPPSPAVVSPTVVSPAVAPPAVAPPSPAVVSPAPAPAASPGGAPRMVHDAPRTVPTPRTGGAVGDASALLAAFEIAQRQTAEAQESFQQTLASSHQRFMAASEASWNAIAGVLAGQPLTLSATFSAEDGRAAALPIASPSFAREALPALESPAAPVPTTPAVPAPLPAAAAPDVGLDVAAAEARVATPAAAPRRDLQALVLEVVSEATGYPQEMLGLDMNLEADLGIDSIKRVEILSLLMKRAPELPELPTGEVGKLATLDAIMKALRDALPDAGDEVAPPPPVPASTSTSTTSSPVVASAPSTALDLESFVLRAVAEKTGYPMEMLGLDMDLEADLGIDSIKRVEILAQVRTLAPELPDLPAAAMSAQRTLRGIIQLFHNAPSGAPVSALPMSSAPSTEPVSGAPSDLTAVATEHAPLEHRVPTPIARGAAGLATPGLLGRVLTIVDDGGGVAARLAAALGRHVTTRVVACDAVIDDSCTSLIDLSGLSAETNKETLSVEAFRRAKALGARLSEHGGLYVTVQDTGGDFGQSGRVSAGGGLIALARTARQEWPLATVRAIDLERGGRDAAALAADLAGELLDGGATPDVGLCVDGRRLELIDAPYQLESARAAGAVGAHDVVLASGGGRGVTATSLIALARASGAAFALLGRSPLTPEEPATRGIEEEAALKRALMQVYRDRGVAISPRDLGREVARLRAAREVTETLQAIEQAGGRAAYFVADVTDASALQAAVAACTARFGPVTAIVHGAGVLADKRIVDKDEETFRQVFRTKVAGLESLLEACEGSPVTRLLVFSSVAARHGNTGQCDYAMANELLNQRAFELAASRPRLRVSAIGWGPWRGGMVTPALARYFGARGIGLIEPELGATAFVDIISANANAPVVVLVGGSLPDTTRTRAPEPVRLDAVIDSQRHAYLLDHRVRGEVVLPLAYVVELMARALENALPGLSVVSLSDVRVLGGVRLEDFATTPTWLSVELSDLTNGEGATATVSVHDASGRKRYAATAVLAAVLPSAPAWSSDALPASAPQSVYGGVLFHGPRFQVVSELTALAAAGSTAQMDGARLTDVRVHARTDVGLVDGALQLALRWTECALHGASLPTRIERIELYRGGAEPGAVTAELRARSEQTGGMRATCDVALNNDAGQPVMRLCGVETHLLPSPSADATVASEPTS